MNCTMGVMKFLQCVLTVLLTSPLTLCEDLLCTPGKYDKFERPFHGGMQREHCL